MSSLMNQQNVTPLRFLRNRLTRIVPLYYLTTAIVVLTGMFRASSDHVVQSLLFLNLQYAVPVYPPGWTLNYEFAFYLVCVLAITWFQSADRRFGFAILCLVALSITGTALRPNDYDGCLLEFAFGIGVFLVTGRIATRSFSNVGWLLFFISIASLLLIEGFGVPLDFQPPGALLRSLIKGPLAAVAVLTLVWAERAGALPHNPMLRRIGDASYTIYMIHLPVYFAFQHWLPANLYANSPMKISILTTLIAMALPFHAFVEIPLTSMCRRILNAYSRQ